MPAVKLIAALLLSSVLVLTGCGATDSGHADSFSANHTDPGADGPNGRESDVAPSITKHPVSVYPYEGEATALSVSAEGTDLSYQWQRAMTNEWVSLPNETGKSLRFRYPSLADSGIYRVIVYSGSASAESQAAEVIVKEKPFITKDPAGQTVALGTNTRFSVSASGHGPLSYAWYKGTTRLRNSNKYSGAESPELVVAGTTDSDRGYYKAVVTNPDGLEVKSRAAYLKVLVPVSISGAVSDLNLAQGSSGKLTVRASGTAPISYEWQKLVNGSWKTVNKASPNPDLDFSSASQQLAGEYRVIVNNVLDKPQASNVVTVTVTETINISEQPSNLYGNQLRATLGDDISFSVSASGTNVSYSWYKNDAVISRNKTLALSNIDLGDTGVYRCRVTNSLGSQWCNSVELVILTPPVLLSQPADISVFEGEPSALTVDFSGSPQPKLQWYKDGSPISGAINKTLRSAALSLEDEGTYTCRVENEAGSADCAPIRVTVKERVRITRPLSNQVTSPGESITLSVQATGEPPLTYQWFKDNKQIQSGEDLSTLTLRDVTSSDNGLYQVVVFNDGSSATSNNASLTVLTTEITHSVSLQWVIPSKRADGSPLEPSSIGGYRVYHSQEIQATSFHEVKFLRGATSNQATIDRLSSGDHYFMITTLDNAGNESDYSVVAHIRIFE